MSYRGHGPLMRTNSHRKDHICVFGSNLAGIHGAGAALYALKFCGAISGRGEGFQGRSYALPTKRSPTVGMTVREVHLHVQVFLAFAARREPVLADSVAGKVAALEQPPERALAAVEAALAAIEVAPAPVETEREAVVTA